MQSSYSSLRSPTKRSSGRKLATISEKVYMGVAAFEALVVFAIAFSAFGIIEANIKHQGSKERTVPVYLANFIFAQIFSLVYAFDALKGRNIIQLGLHWIFNTCILAYSILQIPQTEDALWDEPQGSCGHFKACHGPGSLYDLVKKLFIVTPIVLGLCTIAFAVLIQRLYVQFGWAVFHLVGASPEMKRMHREYQILVSLLKLLFFFAVAFSFAYLLLITTTTRNTADFVLTIITFPLTIIVILGTGWALKRENKPVMATCLILMVAGIAMFTYKLASMFLPATSWLYSNTKITMAIFSAFAIIIQIVTFAYGCLCLANFGKGLVQAHQHPENRSSLWTLNHNKEKGGEAGRAEGQEWNMSPHSPDGSPQQPMIID